MESKFQDKVAEMREKRRQVLEHVEATRRSFRNKLRSSENKAKERFHKLDGFLVTAILFCLTLIILVE